MLTDSQKTSALKAVLDAVVESIKAAGSLGVPGGHLYAVLMTRGCTLEQFETMMGMLERLGKVEKRGQLYFIPKPKRAAERDFGGSFDGFRVTSDADGGL